MEPTREIVASFRLTPELWYEASRSIRRRQHRWLSWHATWPIVAAVALALVGLDRTRWFDEGLLPALILLNAVGALACAALLLAPTLIRRRFDAAYRRLPEANRQVVWRFSPFAVSAEGGMTRFEGGWDDLREIVAAPRWFLIFRQEQSAGVIPVSAFADEEALEDFVFLARMHAPKFVETNSL